MTTNARNTAVSVSERLTVTLMLTVLLGSVPAAVAAAPASEESPVSESETTGASKLAYYDGGWEFGASLDFTNQDNVTTAEDASGAGWGFLVGKHLFRNDTAILGGQLQYTNKLLSVDASSDVALRATSLFATAQFAKFPYVQLKLGLANAKYEDIEGTHSENGIAYGVGIAVNEGRHFVHLIDYAVLDLGPDRASVFSVNLLIFACFLGGC